MGSSCSILGIVYRKGYGLYRLISFMDYHYAYCGLLCMSENVGGGLLVYNTMSDGIL